MPRGPCKKENYNLSYDRFNAFDRDEDEERAKNEADAAGGPMPDMREMLRRMPPELQEAYYLMQVSRESGDAAAQQRANELAIKAVQNGSPEVRQQFIQNVGEQMPELAGKLSDELLGSDGIAAEPPKILEKLQSEAVHNAAVKKIAEEKKQKTVAEETPEETALRIHSLREQMEKGKENTRKELDMLQKKQEEIERIKSPEEFMKFLTEGGITQEDIQRILSGDAEHMEERFRNTIEKQTGSAEELVPQEALQKVDELHSTLFGTPMESPQAANASTESEKPVKKAPAPPKEPEVIIPMYRLQYEKDEAGRYKTVELKCNLPGVADMSVINLDVSEKHLRLTTVLPAPKYAVNAGPFPVLIDPTGARAKYSKKREELSISVPAKVD